MIQLMEGTQPTFKPIYSCSETELEALQEFSEKISKKDLFNQAHHQLGTLFCLYPKRAENYEYALIIAS